jgi:hypothetical protein
VPPEAARLVEYDTCQCACGSGDEVVIVSVGGGVPAIAIESDFEAVLAGAPESRACTVNEKVPPALGVPVMAPLEELRESPGGRLPPVTLQLYGVWPPLATTPSE